MSRKFAVITAITLSAFCGTAGVAAADGNDTINVTGGEDFASAPWVVNAPQQGVIISNGSLVYLPCAAPWSNGAVAGGVVPPNSHYAACDTEAIDQSQNAPYKGGALF